MRIELSRPRTILFPVDLSAHSKGAAALVSVVAERFDSRVVVLNVLEPVDHPFEMFSGGMIETRSLAEVAREKVTGCIREELPRFQSDIRVEEGDPAAVIVRVAEEIDADLICMPTRGHGPFRKFLLGSTAGKVLNDAPVPVLTGAHMDAPKNHVLDIRSVVCAFSPDERGESALRAALLVSKVFGAKLTVAHALEKQQREEVQRAIHAGGGGNAEIVIGDGNPAQLVARTAEGADLVVIGRTAPGPLGRLRGQSYAIIRESPCPVLSV